MTRLLKNKKLILSLIVLVSLSGCMATHFIITLDTPFSMLGCRP